jgi:hypothetical protein
LPLEVIVTRHNNISAERSLIGAVLVSIVVAAIASRVSALAFGSFLAMAAVLIAADIVVYALTKAGLFKSSASQ